MTTPGDGCVDCGWLPPTGERWPSEGARAVRWMQTRLICAEGDWFGKPLRLRDDQKRFVWRWYEACPVCGYWHYDTALRGAATGDGKTTFVAGLECLEMFGPPQIVPVSPNIVNAAASFEQADLLFSIAGTMLGGRDQAVKEAPLCGYAEVYDTEIRYSDGRPGVMKRVAAAAGTNEGGLPSLFLADEVHEWGDLGDRKARVHMVVGKSTAKRRLVCRIPDGDGYREVTRGPGRVLNISTAGFDVDHSLLGAMYKRGKDAERDPLLAPRLLFDWREARPGLDYSRPEDRRIAVQDASAAAGVLWDVEKRVREYDKAEVEAHEWVRYYANSWVKVPEDSWLVKHPDAWGKCQSEWELAGDEDTVLSVDMSLTRDSTAVVECTQLRDGRIAVTARIWVPKPGHQVPHDEVFAHIKERALELGPRFRGVVYDPRFFELPALMLEADGFAVIQFDQTAVLMAPAVGDTFDAIIGQLLVHDGDDEFTRQVLAAAKRQQERGFTLSKGRSKRRIDAAVAMCMGVGALKRLPSKHDVLQQVW